MAWRALTEIADRPLIKEPKQGDYGKDRERCPSCKHAWHIDEEPHHAPACDRMIAVAARREMALATHPAPATPEGLREALTDLHTIAGWLDGLASCPDLNDVAADGGVTVGMCYQQEAREFAGRFRRVLAALAREARDE